MPVPVPLESPPEDPALALDLGTDPLELVAAAALAPSSHNTQPWRFTVSADRVELRADRSRRLPVNDPDDRELTISCGAALLNLRAAAAAAGLDATVDVLPCDDDPELLARVSLAPGAGDRALADLAAAIPGRHTARVAFTDECLDASLLARLEAAARSEGAWLEPLSSTGRARLAELVTKGDRLQFQDSAWRKELATWMRTGSTGDGMAMFGLATPLARLAVGALDLGRSTASKNAKLARQAPAVYLLTTTGDRPADWLRAGQGLERALLVAAAEGVQAAYLNQPCQIASLRGQLVELTGAGHAPQVVLRLGHPADELPPSPRRPVTEVIDDSGAGGA